MAGRTKVRGWRKISAATWGAPSDPQIFGDLDVDATALLEFIDDARDAGARVTVTHVVGKALAHAFAANPDLNVRLARNSFIRRDTVDVFFIASIGDGTDLSGVKVESADQKAVVDIARELDQRAQRIRSGSDAEFGKTKAMMDRIPRRLLHVILRAAAFLTSDLNLDLARFGLPRQAFGSVMVSSVGMFGIEHAYAPIAPYYKVPLLVLVGQVVDKPTVVDEQVQIRPSLTLSATIDHRYLDGFHAARLARSVREYLEDPKRFEPPLA